MNTNEWKEFKYIGMAKQTNIVKKTFGIYGVFSRWTLRVLKEV